MLWFTRALLLRITFPPTEEQLMSKAILRALPGVLVLWAGCLLAAPARAGFDDVFDRTVPLQAGGSFELQNVKGSVELPGWDRNEGQIHAVKSAKRKQRDLGRVSIEVSERPNAVSVLTHYPHDEGVEVAVEYRIHVPRDAQVRRVATVNGGLHVSGIRNAGELRTVNGNVELFDSAGRISAHSTNGNLRLELNRFDSQSSLSAETVNGSVMIGMPSGAGGSIDAVNLNVDFCSPLPGTLGGAFGPRQLHRTLRQGGRPLRVPAGNR